VVPANHKHIAWLIVSAAIIDAMKGLKLHYPLVKGRALTDLMKAERRLRKET